MWVLANTGAHYDEVAGDTTLRHFSIQPDLDNYMIPGLQQALAIQPGLKLFASPWTPPVWMKNSGVFNEGALKPEFYGTWALYFSKYIEAYQQNGVPIWAVTPQNEPEAYRQAWDACGWTPSEMNAFVQQYLGPRLQKDHSTVKIIAWDHNKNHLMDWCKGLLNDPKTAPYLSYIAHHWYDGGEARYFEPLQAAYKTFPDHPLLATEQGVFGLFLHQPDPAEMYARDIIGNMNNHSAAWVVWGMAFDTGGGPNHAKNFNHSPIMVDLQQQQLHYNPSYWYIAHFSKFVQPGAYRIEFQKNQSNLEITAFQNPNGQVVVALLNTSNQKVACQLKWGERFLPFTVDAKCIKTVIWQN